MLTSWLTLSCTQQQADYPFRNPDLPVDERVEDLLNRLTPEEKVVQMMNATPAIERLGIPPYDWWNEDCFGGCGLDICAYPLYPEWKHNYPEGRNGRESIRQSCGLYANSQFVPI